jgi:cell surface protein SprA
MFEGMPETRTGNFTLSTIALRTAFESPKASNGYASKAFDRFLANRPSWPPPGRKNGRAPLPEHRLPEEFQPGRSAHDPAQGRYDLTAADVQIPAFLASDSGRAVTEASMDLFPVFGLVAQLDPFLRWALNLSFIKNTSRTSLNHNYTCNYGVSSFASTILCGAARAGFCA